MRRLTLGVLSLLLVVCAAGRAHALDPARAITQYAHKTWTKNDGLPASGLLTMLQARDGFIWFGTFSGLVRFDGVTFTTYTTANTSGMTNDGVWTLCETPDGTLWIGTNGGGLLAYRDGAMTAFSTKDGLPSNIVTVIQKAVDGRLWVGTRTGVCLFDPKQPGATRRFDLEGGGGFTSSTTDLSLQPDGSLDIGTEDGLFRVPRGGGAVVRTDISDPIRSLYLDRDGSAWVAVQGKGIRHRKDGVTREYTTADGLTSNTVRAFCRDREGNLWLGTSDGGLCRMRDGRVTAFTEADGLTNDAIQCLLEDTEGNLWVGSYRNGLNRFQDGRVLPLTIKEGLPVNTVFSAYADGPNVWLATSLGLSRYADGKIVENIRLSPDRVGDNIARCVLRTRAGTLLVGSDRLGLLVFDENRRVFTPRPLKGLPNGRVRALVEDGAGVLWVGTQYGLVRIEGDTERAFTIADGLTNNIVLSLELDRDGRLWIPTNGGGLNFYRDGKFGALTTRDGLPSDVVFEAFTDRAGTVWALTTGGLARVDGARATPVTTRQGLWNNNLHQILEDDEGHFWIGSDAGIGRIARTELMEAADGKRTALSNRIFGRADGMKNDEVAGTGIAAAVGGGQLWFATVAGVAVIEPRRIALNTLPPPIFVRRSGLGQERSEISGPLEFPYARNTFEIDYTALCFRASEQVRFKYRLRGLNDEWTDAGTRRTAYFTNIPPGRYEFEVIAANNDGLWNDAPARLRVTVLPPLWRTWWAYVGYVLLCGALLVTGVRLQAARLRARASLAEAELRAEAAEIQAKVAEASIAIKDRDAEISRLRNVELAEANRMITDSIRYAERLQAAALPDIGALRDVFDEAFVLYAPKDIVSGDFYWFHRFEDECLLAVADCTGHGVPGAFMSMVGNVLLNQIVIDRDVRDPATVLEALHEGVRLALRRERRAGETDDGMDIAICRFEPRAGRMTFAGAGRPLYVVDHEGRFTEFKGTRRNIGSVRKFGGDAPFENVSLTVADPLAVYLTTDGFADQPAADGVKFGAARLKKLIAEVGDRPFNVQRDAIRDVLNTHTGDEPQRDDITLVAVRFSPV